jgi:hypothetical protein
VTITTADQLVAGQVRPVMWAPIAKASMTSVANRWQSTWTAGGAPGAGTAPGAATIPNKTTAGALVNFPTLSGGGFEAYGDPSGLSNSVAGAQVLIFDRLAHMSGLNGTLATAQTVNVGPPDRGDVTAYSNVVVLVEVYTATGATPTTVSVSYTNGTGTSGRTSPALTWPASAAAGNCFLLPLQAGDQSVRSVQTLTLGVSTGTAGNFGVTLARLVGSINVSTIGQQQASPIATMGVVPENACLWAVVIPPSTASGAVQGGLKIIEG